MFLVTIIAFATVFEIKLSHSLNSRSEGGRIRLRLAPPRIDRACILTTESLKVYRKYRLRYFLSVSTGRVDTRLGCAVLADVGFGHVSRSTAAFTT